MEPEPTEQEKALFDTFCHEYLVDGDHAAAASRCGFQAGFAAEYGKRFLERSYVQKRLRMLRETPADEKQEREYTTRAVRNVLRDIMTNPYQRATARVAAAAKLASIYGMDAPIKKQLDITQRGGVMEVPAIPNLEDWEAQARASQGGLIEASRVV